MTATKPMGYGRFRIPIMPLVAVLAGIGAAAVFGRRARRPAGDNGQCLP